MSEGDRSKYKENYYDADTGYTFTDDHWIRFRNTWKYFTGGLTAEGERQYQQGRDLRYEKADCKRCEDTRDYLLQYSTDVPHVGWKQSS